MASPHDQNPAANPPPPRSAHDSGSWAPIMAPHVGPPPPPQIVVDGGSVWWKILAVGMPAIFAAGGAWVQLEQLRAEMAHLRSAVELHAAQPGHRESMARIGVLERDSQEYRESQKRVDAYFTQIRDTLSLLCASQPRNPCRGAQ